MTANVSCCPLQCRKPLKGRGTKPADKQAVVSWFKETEEPRGAGLDPKTQQVAKWFHGRYFVVSLVK